MYILVRYREDGSYVRTEHNFGFQAHALGMANPKEFVCYAIEIEEPCCGYGVVHCSYYEKVRDKGWWVTVPNKLNALYLVDRYNAMGVF